MKTADFDFPLPESAIARTPLERRDRSRLLVLRGDSLEHRHFSDLPGMLERDDMIVINNTKVMPARIRGIKPTGGKIDILIVKQTAPGEYSVLSRGRYSGAISLPGGVEAELIDGERLIMPLSVRRDYFWKYGSMPLPPYIKREPDERDRQWYQTVYARREGSIAAPTAGLHFSESLLAELKDRGIPVREITLHVGTGTFKPVKAETVTDHRMDPEEFEIDRKLLEEIRANLQKGRRVVAVGTTVTRTLEAVFSGRCSELPSPNKEVLRGTTDLFIYPGFRFRAITSLITNFHLPRSTPLVLVSAFAGRERILRAYQEAIERGYRFFSYGDAMLIL